MIYFCLNLKSAGLIVTDGKIHTFELSNRGLFKNTKGEINHHNKMQPFPYNNSLYNRK